MGNVEQKVLVLNGPNLNRLGKREPEIYGSRTLDDVLDALEVAARSMGALIEARQSNHEGDLLDWIGSAEDEGFSGILINPGALTHTSVALYDAIKGTALPVVEVHISNPEAREAFRRENRVAPACLGKVAGFGQASYELALRGLLGHVKSAQNPV